MGRISSNDRFDWYNQSGAMKNDLIRALIELITNSNEAYSEEEGDIDVIINNSKKGELYIEVRDYARGISNILASLTRGETTAGIHNNKQSRGRHGRGLKDVPVLAIDETFLIKTVVRKNKEYFEVKFLDNANYEGTEEDISTPKSIPQNCEFTEGGTSISFKVKPRVNPRRPDLIKTKLQTHIELREIINQRNVNFIVNGEKETLISTFKNEEKVIFEDGKLDVPDYKNYVKKYGEISYQIYKLEKPTTTKIDEYSHAGILINGNGISYNNEHFGKKDYSEMFYIHGQIDIPFIDQLYLEFDTNRENPISLNPMSIITTNRDGLEKAHPLFQQIEQNFEPILDRYINQIRDEKKDENYSDSKNLKNASKLFSQIAKNLNLLGDDDSDTDVLLEFRPPALKIYKDTKKTASIVADSSKFKVGDEIVFKISSGENIEITEKTKELTSHLNNPNLLSATIEVEGSELGQAVITAKCGKLKAFNDLNIEIVPQPEPKIIEFFQFENKSYTTPEGLDSKKNIVLLVPEAEYQEHEKTVSLNVKDKSLFEIKSNSEELYYSNEHKAYAASFEITNTKFAAPGISTLLYAKYNGEEIKASIRVRKINPASSELKIEFNQKEYSGVQRVTYRPATENSPQIYEVNLKHPVIKEVVLEPQMENLDKDFERSFITEILLDEIVRRSVYDLVQEEDLDLFDGINKLDQIRKEQFPQFYAKLRKVKYGL